MGWENLLRNDRIRKRFFGTSEISPVVILTPITALYDIFESYPKVNETKGWWQQKEVVLNKKKTSLIKIPQGNSVIDVIESLDEIEKVIFMGYAGGLSNNVDIGNILCPHTALFENLSGYRTNTQNFNGYNVNEGKVMLTNSFFEQDQQFIDMAKSNNVVGVDMETYLVYSRCNAKNILVDSFLIVTDLIDKKQFYMTTDEDLSLVDKSYKPLEELVINAI